MYDKGPLVSYWLFFFFSKQMLIVNYLCELLTIVTVLSSFDLSAAFDTINHDTFISVFITPLAYLTLLTLGFILTSSKGVRIFFVCVDGISSAPSLLKFGVPQGSVLDPFLFVLYNQPLSDCVHHHSLSHLSLSDDNQLHKRRYICHLQNIIQSTQCCITSDMKDWMTDNKLQLNEDRTNMIFYFTKQSAKQRFFPI